MRIKVIQISGKAVLPLITAYLTSLHYFRFIMYRFSNTHISVASLKDVTAVTHLLNSAYRGESSKRGWTTEAHLISGNIRTDENNLKQIMQQPQSVILKYVNGAGEIIGCVNLQQHDAKVYLGMFSVLPHLQGSGIGKQILAAADEYAKHLQCISVYMSVISVREELISWYKRNGYVATGERKPFIEDNLTGKHLQPLEFIILEKILD